MGGAQRDKDEAIRRVGTAIRDLLAELSGRAATDLRQSRRRKFLDMGQRSLVA